MPDKHVQVIDGPDKPALLWAVSYPEREEVVFKLEEGALQARLSCIEECDDGFSFDLEGEVIAGPDDGRPFRASYSVTDRRGLLTIIGGSPV